MTEVGSNGIPNKIFANATRRNGATERIVGVGTRSNEPRITNPPRQLPRDPAGRRAGRKISIAIESNDTRGSILVTWREGARIRCVNETERLNPDERIRDVGGVNADGTRWRRTQQKTIEEIESGEWEFCAHESGKTVNVIVTHNGNKYIKTEADGIHPDNLLALPECPSP